MHVACRLSSVRKKPLEGRLPIAQTCKKCIQTALCLLDYRCFSWSWVLIRFRPEEPFFERLKNAETKVPSQFLRPSFNSDAAGQSSRTASNNPARLVVVFRSVRGSQ
jgi:hypothetical protein